jgi:Fe-S cluster assembly iron-binding protein IscA
MLKVTETASAVFRKVLEQDQVRGTAIRLLPADGENGRPGIEIQPIDRPAPTDQPTEATGVEVVVAAELAPLVEDAVLDARETDGGADLFLREAS